MSASFTPASVCASRFLDSGFGSRPSWAWPWPAAIVRGWFSPYVFFLRLGVRHKVHAMLPSYLCVFFRSLVAVASHCNAGGALSHALQMGSILFSQCLNWLLCLPCLAFTAYLQFVGLVSLRRALEDCLPPVGSSAGFWIGPACAVRILAAVGIAFLLSHLTHISQPIVASSLFLPPVSHTGCLHFVCGFLQGSPPWANRHPLSRSPTASFSSHIPYRSLAWNDDRFRHLHLLPISECRPVHTLSPDGHRRICVCWQAACQPLLANFCTHRRSPPGLTDGSASAVKPRRCMELYPVSSEIPNIQSHRLWEWALNIIASNWFAVPPQSSSHTS